MEYYMKRNNLLPNELNIELDELKSFFYQIYNFFYEKEYFELAFNGVYESNYGNAYLVEEPTMKPSPQIYFMNQLNDSDCFPINRQYMYYAEEQLFTIIEMLNAHIAIYDHTSRKTVKKEPQKEFNEYINSILKLYKNGYYLDTLSGCIMEMPNESLEKMLSDEVPSNMSNNEVEQLKTSVSMFYRFNANQETKKKAINILADILEPLRDELKDLLNEKYDVNKNEHDKLIFDIVNNFNIRHNNKKQSTEYDKEVWYDWMMQYYTSVILAYYKLKLNKSS